MAADLKDCLTVISENNPSSPPIITFTINNHLKKRGSTAGKPSRRCAATLFYAVFRRGSKQYAHTIRQDQFSIFQTLSTSPS